VEAGKLRKRLEEYYAEEGVEAPLRIEVPKGSYIPQFRLRTQPAALHAPARAMHRHRYAAGAVALLITLQPQHWPHAPARPDLVAQVVDACIRGFAAAPRSTSGRGH